MIWESVALMTIIDLLIVFVCVLTLLAYWRFRKPIRELGARVPLMMAVAGLAAMGGLYAADLYTMHVLPLHASPGSAMRAMTELHLNWSWLISLLGLGGIAIGALLLMRALLPALSESQRRLRQEIENRIAVEKELRQSQDRLVQQERLAVLGTITATVSHELRNPLGSIANSIHTLRSATGRQTDQQHLFDRITRNLKRCEQIILELLDFSRSRKLKFTPVDFDTWLSDVLNEYGEPKHIVVKRELASKATLPIDKALMQSVFVNLLNNAAHAMLQEDDTPRAGGEIRVSAGRAEDKLICRIEDNGHGMPADVLEKVFEPLYTTKNLGIGLGMTIVQRTVEQHGGKLELESAPGKGTRVTIILDIPKDLVATN